MCLKPGSNALPDDPTPESQPAYAHGSLMIESMSFTLDYVISDDDIFYLYNIHIVSIVTVYCSAYTLVVLIPVRMLL